MDIAEALSDLAAALAAAEGARGRDARLRAARQVVADRCVTALGLELPGQPSIAAVIKLAADAPDRPARRDCAVLVVHALAVPGLVPAACAGDVYSLLESALRTCCCAVRIRSVDGLTRRRAYWNASTPRSES